MRTFFVQTEPFDGYRVYTHKLFGCGGVLLSVPDKLWSAVVSVHEAPDTGRLIALKFANFQPKECERLAALLIVQWPTICTPETPEIISADHVREALTQLIVNTFEKPKER